MATDWFYKAGDYEWGPLAQERLIELVAQGRIGRDTLVRKGTTGRWVAAGNLKGLAFPEQNQGPAPAPDERVTQKFQNRKPDDTPPKPRNVLAVRPIQFPTATPPLLPQKSSNLSRVSVWGPPLLILVAVAAGATMVWMKITSSGLERKVADPAARDKAAKRPRAANAVEQIKKREKLEAKEAVAEVEPEAKRDKPEINADFIGNLKPEKVAAKKTPIKVRHIHRAMEEAGFDLYRFGGGGVRISTQIADYIHYGSAAAAIKAVRGDHFDRLEAGRNAQKHRESISKDHFYLPNLAVSFAGESKTSGLYLLRCPVPHLRLWTDKSIGMSHLEHVDYRSAWFLTTGMKLQGPLSAQEVNFVRANDGIIFNRESSETTLILMTDEQQAKRVSRNPNSFACHLVISNLSWSEPPKLRFYREDAVRISDFDCQGIDSSADVGINMQPVFDTSNDRHFAYAVAQLRQLTIQEVGTRDAVYRANDEEMFVIPADIAIPMNRNLAGELGNNAVELRPKPQATKSLAVPAKRVMGNSPKSRIPEKAYTGLNVKKGQKVRMNAQGTIKVGHGMNETAGPEALLIAIGESGKPAVQKIRGQAEVEFVVEHDGGVFIGICNPSPEDNRGELNVKIEVFD